MSLKPVMSNTHFPYYGDHLAILPEEIAGGDNMPADEDDITTFPRSGTRNPGRLPIGETPNSQPPERNDAGDVPPANLPTEPGTADPAPEGAEVPERPVVLPDIMPRQDPLDIEPPTGPLAAPADMPLEPPIGRARIIERRVVVRESAGGPSVWQLVTDDWLPRAPQRVAWLLFVVVLVAMLLRV